GRGREQGGRARGDRRRDGGSRRARRLYAAVHRGLALRAQSGAVQEAVIRSGEGFPDAGADHGFARRDGGASLGPREHRCGVRGLRQAKSRQAEFRFGRHRRHHSSGRRDVQADGRRRYRACALQGRRSCAERSALRQYPADVRYARHRAAAGQGRHVASARGELAPAHRRSSRRSDHCGERLSRLRRRRVVR
ncbi:hypothetical protein KXV85_002435, partial [Aspergillus fumigatus]